MTKKDKMMKKINLLCKKVPNDSDKMEWKQKGVQETI